MNPDNELPRDYFKIPFELNALATKYKLSWDKARKLWFKSWTHGIKPNLPELNQYKYSFRTNKFLTGKSNTMLVALHYWPINDATATGALLANIPLKQDKNKKWYLPEFSDSKEQFRINLNTMTTKFGNPKTVIFRK